VGIGCVSEPVEIRPAGSEWPQYSDRTGTASGVVCPFDFAIVPGVDAEAAQVELRDKYPRTTPLIFGSPKRASVLIRTINPIIQPDEILKQAANFDLEGWLAERWAYLQEKARDLGKTVPRHGEWPTNVAPTTDVYAARDTNGEFSPGVVIALVPCKDYAAAAAYLRFGGWDDCPRPWVHVAIANRWAASHSAVLVASTSATLEFRVARPITTRTDAMEMAMTHYLYDFETVQQPGTIERAAASLVGSTVWGFWWD
jgi:uncharacterized protein DUF4253